jgi:hypothetical protein
VFELDPRYDSTVAGSPVLPVRDPARTPAPAGEQESPHGAQEPGPQAPASTGPGRTGGRAARPLAPPGRTADTGPALSATGGPADGTTSPYSPQHAGVGPAGPATATAGAAPHPPRPDERRGRGVPRAVGQDGSPAVDTIGVAAPLDTRRHNGHGRPPRSNGSHRPEGPAADHGGNPGDPPDAGSPVAGSPGAGTPGPGAFSRPPGAARSATSDTDGLGLGDLLAGALAAYRNI